MFNSYKIKSWLSWPLVRAHLCTLAVSVGLPATWHTPRGAFTYGGFQYGLAVTFTMAVVALPLSLLQLAVGQLSQQDAVGIWRAVPFFKGVGYLRLLVSFLSSIYTVTYLALAITFFFYTINNSLSFWECIEVDLSEGDDANPVNASSCLNETFMAPVSSKPEYYLAVALIVVVLWIILPFIFYNSVKFMKRLFYLLGPVVIIIAIVIVSCIGDKSNLPSFVLISDWKSFREPYIWHGALVQALISSQIAGGYLISAGDAIYSSNNVQWTAVAIILSNIVSSWLGLIFWYSIIGASKDTEQFAVLIQTYQVMAGPDTDLVWPLMTFFMITLSGSITLLTLVFPIYDRLRRLGGVRWRLLSACGSLVGIAVTLGTLAVRRPGLILLEDLAVPLLISVATVLEILPFIFIYGWKILVEDIEFLTGGALAKYWVLGWCAAPGVIVPLTAWWVTVEVVQDEDWTAPPWTVCTIISAAVLAVFIVIVFSSVAVAQQVQYDCIQKLKSSFSPSRHWGPRDPITHYYWLARREELNRGQVHHIRHHRRELGQFSGRNSILHQTYDNQLKDDYTKTEKQRSNSDDRIYTICRKQMTRQSQYRRRAASLDWPISNKHNSYSGTNTLQSTLAESMTSQNSVCNSIDKKYSDVIKK